MNILVCSKVSIPAKDRTLPAWEYLRSLGNTVVVDHPNNCPKQPDAIISMGVSVMEETFAAIERFLPGTPLYCYNWDTYEWVWANPRKGEYDYRKYGELLKKATEIWVPSGCTGRRTTQWWGLDNWRVILSACPYWDYANVRDDGYALCTLREIPDPWWGMFEKCCSEIGIPYKMTRHECSYEEYQDIVAGCRFLCAPLYELSTGGLTLMEGYYLGKPSLISDSEWNGARDYFGMGTRATYFRHGDETDFKRTLEAMYARPPMIDRLESSKWVEKYFSDKRMIDDMLRRIEAA